MKIKLMEMANLTKRGTGLPVNLWVDGGGIKRRISHSSYRLKMQNGYGDRASKDELVPISIDKVNPDLLIDTKLMIKQRDFKLVQKFIIEHYDDFDLFIRGEIDEDELKDRVYTKVGV